MPAHSLRWFVRSLAIVAAAVTLAAAEPSRPIGTKSSAVAPSAARAAYARLPLMFEPNRGQWDTHVRFLSRGPGYDLFLTSSEAVLVSGDRVLRMALQDANPQARITGLQELRGRINYFRGNDPAEWRTNIPTYASVRYTDVYPGVDLVYYGNQRELEYDFVVAPGADVESIALTIDGADRLQIDAAGDLVMQIAGSEIRQRKPRIYQEIDGVRQEIAGRYVFDGRHAIGFAVGAYDATRPLIIDPVLVYSTYIGGSTNDYGSSIGVDASGNAYIAGGTLSNNFPVSGAFQGAFAGGWEAFVSKLNSDGTALVYSTYLGGSSSDEALAIALDASGNAFITGYTASANFPTTAGALDRIYGGHTDAFVAQLDPTGAALVYSTYLGSSEYEGGRSIAIDASGSAYVTGETDGSFPTTAGSVQSSFGGAEYDAFVAKLNPAGSALVYSTYLGGDGWEQGLGIAVDAAGDAYITGRTKASDFPTTPGAFQTSYGGGADDGFVAQVNPDGSSLVYSTYLGGSQQDISNEIAVDTSGNAYVVGTTVSTDFPTTSGGLHSTAIGAADAFVTKMNPTGSAVVYSTFLGGTGFDFGDGIALDTSHNAYVTGHTNSTGIATAGAFQPTLDGAINVYVAKLNPLGSGLLYLTYLGGSGVHLATGIAVDAAFNAYVTGSAQAATFPTTAGAFQTTFGGALDGFVAKIFEHDTPIGANIIVQPADTTTGTTPVTLTFSSVTAGGSTTLTTSGTGAPPPQGFRLGNPPIYYELTTTAVFSGPITICFIYAGVSFQDPSQLRIFHQEGNAWVDRTSSLDTVNMIICATVSSLSPFAIFERVPYHFTGFLAPLSAASFSGVFKQGSTIPIKWQLTDDTGAFVTSAIATTTLEVDSETCTGGDDGTPPFDPGTSGSTGLRYDAASNQYVFNWQTKGLAAGCYTIAMNAGDGPSRMTSVRLK